MANICGSNQPENLAKIMAAGTVQKFDLLLKSRIQTDIQANILFSLCNLLGSNPECRAIIMESDCFKTAIITCADSLNQEICDNLAWMYSVALDEPYPNFPFADDIVKLLCKLFKRIQISKESILPEECAYGIQRYLAPEDNAPKRKDTLLTENILDKFIKLLEYPEDKTVYAALRAIERYTHRAATYHLAPIDALALIDVVCELIV